MKFFKNVRNVIAMALIAGMAFLVGAIATHPATATVNVQTVAGELTPVPYGSGALGDWSTLSHGVYCFTNGVLTNSVSAKTTTPAWFKYAKNMSTNVASTWCPGEDVRLYGDSITFGGKSAFASALNDKTVMVDAWSGRPTTPIGDAIMAETSFPPVVVIASGTNDVFNPSVMAAQVVRIRNHIKSVSPNTKLFWVDVQITRWGQTDVIERNDQRNGEAINYVLWNNLDKTQIIQWSGRFLQQPGLLTTYLSDGVHPKPGTGYAYWAATLKGWLTTLGGI